MRHDRDAATAWNAASDGTMEERVYYAQNFPHNVSALVTSWGDVDDFEGTTPPECDRCWKTESQTAEIQGVLAFMRIACDFRLNLICTRTHQMCQSTGAGGFFDPPTGKIFICVNRPHCSRVRMIVRHELYHAYERCFGFTNNDCDDVICNERRAYKFDGGSSTPWPDGRLQRGQTVDQCDRYWVWWSTSQQGCNMNKGEVGARIDALAGDPICGW